MGMPLIMRVSNHRECRTKSGKIGSPKRSCNILSGNTPPDLVWLYPPNRASTFPKRSCKMWPLILTTTVLHDITNISYQIKSEFPTWVVMGMPLIMRFSNHKNFVLNRAISGRQKVLAIYCQEIHPKILYDCTLLIGRAIFIKDLARFDHKFLQPPFYMISPTYLTRSSQNSPPGYPARDNLAYPMIILLDLFLNFYLGC